MGEFTYQIRPFYSAISPVLLCHQASMELLLGLIVISLRGCRYCHPL